MAGRLGSKFPAAGVEWWIKHMAKTPVSSQICFVRNIPKADIPADLGELAVALNHVAGRAIDRTELAVALVQASLGPLGPRDNLVLGAALARLLALDEPAAPRLVDRGEGAPLRAGAAPGAGRWRVRHGRLRPDPGWSAKRLLATRPASGGPRDPGARGGGVRSS